MAVQENIFRVTFSERFETERLGTTLWSMCFTAETNWTGADCLIFTLEYISAMIDIYNTDIIGFLHRLPKKHYYWHVARSGKLTH
jgi:hypothetical protein